MRSANKIQRVVNIMHELRDELDSAAIVCHETQKQFDALSGYCQLLEETVDAARRNDDDAFRAGMGRLLADTRTIVGGLDDGSVSILAWRAAL